MTLGRVLGQVSAPIASVGEIPQSSCSIPIYRTDISGAVQVFCRSQGVSFMSLRPPTLELAVLGRLVQGPSHGYEVRKHVNMVLGYLHRVSYGSLYPALRRLLERGLICDCGSGLPRLVRGRSRRIYHLTPLGEEYLADQLASDDESVWTNAFGVQFSLLGMTDRRNRLRILRGQRDSTAARLMVVESWAPPRADHYSTELVQHSREMVGHELAWLDRVIAAEEVAFNKENR